VSAAAEVLDLTKFPLMSGSRPPLIQTVATLHYQAPGKAAAVYTWHLKHLLQMGWKEAPGGYSTEDLVSGTFTHAGYVLTVTAIPAQEAGFSKVALVNLGNVPLDSLPMPPGARQLFASLIVRMLITESAVEPVTLEIRKALEQQGWQPYGDAGPQHFYRKNAIRLSATIGTAPAQGGKTSISYSTELMSAELPALPQAQTVIYSDTNRELGFETTQDTAEVHAAYRNLLRSAGWTATTDQPLKVGFRDTTIFRNPQAEMLTLETRVSSGILRGQLRFRTAKQVQELDRKARAAAAKEKAQQGDATDPVLPKVVIHLSSGMEIAEHEASRAVLRVKPGKARAAADQLRKSLLETGWKAGTTMQQDLFGTMIFEQSSRAITLVYVDSGLTPAEIRLQGTGIDFELQPMK
jgi:hypothetical protein